MVYRYITTFVVIATLSGCATAPETTPFVDYPPVSEAGQLSDSAIRFVDYVHQRKAPPRELCEFVVNGVERYLIEKTAGKRAPDPWPTRTGAIAPPETNIMMLIFFSEVQSYQAQHDVSRSKAIHRVSADWAIDPKTGAWLMRADVKRLPQGTALKPLARTKAHEACNYIESKLTAAEQAREQQQKSHKKL